MTIDASFPESFVDIANYWQEIRADSSVPNRENFNPFRLAEHLSKCLVLEKHHDDKSVIRLAGTDFYNRFGVEFTGSDYVEYLKFLRGNDVLDSIEQEMTAIMTHPCGMMGCREWVDDGRIYANHFLYLPFLKADMKTKQILSFLEYENEMVYFVKNLGHDFGKLRYYYAIDIGEGVHPFFDGVKSIALADILNTKIS